MLKFPSGTYTIVIPSAGRVQVELMVAAGVKVMVGNAGDVSAGVLLGIGVDVKLGGSGVVCDRLQLERMRHIATNRMKKVPGVFLLFFMITPGGGKIFPVNNNYTLLGFSCTPFPSIVLLRSLREPAPHEPSRFPLFIKIILVEVNQGTAVRITLGAPICTVVRF
jgi:hypothetical protein